MVNDPPAFSNPRAWIHFHATFDFFHWKMSSGSCDSRSQNRSSSLPSSFPLLYHSERKLVLDTACYVFALVPREQIPRLQKHLLTDLREPSTLLPPRRLRFYPRVIKRAYSPFHRKRPGQQGFTLKKQRSLLKNPF